ncbi:hypothetical protein NIES2111_28140 [Nostoc sp. NIES-2111]|nr:hypothetical protein NIES2111_28140 [Nostoc sp. NIES-2111]
MTESKQAVTAMKMLEKAHDIQARLEARCMDRKATTSLAGMKYSVIHSFLKFHTDNLHTSENQIIIHSKLKRFYAQNKIITTAAFDG